MDVRDTMMLIAAGVAVAGLGVAYLGTEDLRDRARDGVRRVGDVARNLTRVWYGGEGAEQNLEIIGNNEVQVIGELSK